MAVLRGGINIQMGDMGDTFFADISCNNQLYIVWGGGTTYGLLLISFCCLFDTYVGEEQTLNIQQQLLKSKTYNNQLHNYLNNSKQYKLKY